MKTIIRETQILNTRPIMPNLSIRKSILCHTDIFLHQEHIVVIKSGSTTLRIKVRKKTVT